MYKDIWTPCIGEKIPLKAEQHSPPLPSIAAACTLTARLQTHGRLIEMGVYSALTLGV